MDDEDKIILAGLGTFGALAYIAIKEIQERDALEEESKSSQASETLEAGYTLSEKEKKEFPIYKDILQLLLGRK
jgi:glycerol-3-phosphate dehydrogenase